MLKVTEPQDIFQGGLQVWSGAGPRENPSEVRKQSWGGDSPQDFGTLECMPQVPGGRHGIGFPVCLAGFRFCFDIISYCALILPFGIRMITPYHYMLGVRIMFTAL